MTINTGTTNRLRGSLLAALFLGTTAVAVGLLFTYGGNDTAAGMRPDLEEPTAQRCYGTAEDGIAITVGADRKAITGWRLPWGPAADRVLLSGTALDPDEYGIDDDQFRVSMLRLPADPEAKSSVATSTWTITEETMTVTRPGELEALDSADCGLFAAEVADVQEAGIAFPDLPINDQVTRKIDVTLGRNRTCYANDSIALALHTSDDGARINGWGGASGWFEDESSTTISGTRIEHGVEAESESESTLGVYSLALLNVEDREFGVTTIEYWTVEVTPDAVTPVTVEADAVPAGEPIPVIDCVYINAEVDSIADIIVDAAYPLYPVP